MGYSVIRAGTLARWPRCRQLADPGFRDDLAGAIAKGVRAGRDHVDPDHRGLCLCGYHRRCDLADRCRRTFLGGASRSCRCQPLLARSFAMGIAILLGMGMPTTAATPWPRRGWRRALCSLVFPQLTAHFFVFDLLRCCRPSRHLSRWQARPAAGIAGANPRETSVVSFKVGIAAFIVPFMFVYNSALVMDGTWFEVIRAGITATFGVFLLSGGGKGWFVGQRAAMVHSPRADRRRPLHDRRWG